MVYWEKFLHRELIHNAVEETRKGRYVAYPRLIWIAMEQRRIN